MAARTDFLQSAFRASNENESVVDFTPFHEDVVSKHEITERDHQRPRRLLEHLDDDDAIVNEGVSNECEPSDLKTRQAAQQDAVTSEASLGSRARADWRPDITNCTAKEVGTILGTVPIAISLVVDSC